MKDTDYKLLDSSAWLALFHESSKRVQEIVEEKRILFTSILSIFEVRRKLMRWKVAKEDLEEVMNFIKKRSIVLPLDEEIVEDGARESMQHELGAIDALIFATAKKAEATVVTGDNDFKGLSNVEMIDD